LKTKKIGNGGGGVITYGGIISRVTHAMIFGQNIEMK